MKKLYVQAIDTFMSGWGEAKNKLNLYVIPCDDRIQASIAIENLRNRGDMKAIQTVTVCPKSDEKYLVSMARQGHVYHTKGAIKREGQA